jgi:hypothetical protein
MRPGAWQVLTRKGDGYRAASREAAGLLASQSSDAACGADTGPGPNALIN